MPKAENKFTFFGTTEEELFLSGVTRSRLLSSTRLEEGGMSVLNQILNLLVARKRVQMVLFRPVRPVRMPAPTKVSMVLSSVEKDVLDATIALGWKKSTALGMLKQVDPTGKTFDQLFREVMARKN